MLAEFLEGRGDWAQVMPGARACLFSLHDEPVSLPLRLEPLHFEALFCLAGSITLTRRDNTILTASVRQVLLLTDLSDLSGASVDAPLAGILVAVDARGARESLQTICDLLGGLTLDTGRVRHWMASRGGCAVEGPTDWSRAAFANLGCLPQSERNPKEQEDATLALERETARRLAEIRRYMEEHLDEPLTIPFLSRRACLSTTTFKEGFRRLYGLPVHTWLRQRRMERAAELLRDSSLSVLGVAQSVGYGSASQFSAAFHRQYGMTPAKYRKMSGPA